MPYKRLIETWPYASRMLTVVAGISLAACSTIEPHPLVEKDLIAQARADQEQARAGVDPVTGEITLEEAMARALKYNLDRRVRMMEEAVALKQLDVTQLDMLPKVLAQSGYSSRSNDNTRLNPDSGGLVPSTTQERSHTLSELGLSWNALDLGMGYYNSIQQADRFLIASERRRKAMHLLMQDVRVAFWRAASAQKMQRQVEETIKLAEEALADARKVETTRVRNPVETLRYQRQVLENLRLLEAIAQELSAAPIELASLINAPLGQPLRVAEPTDTGVKLKLLEIPIEEMELFAMQHNADIREQHYNARIARTEARKVLMRMFPNLNFDYSLNYDTDNYLVNSQWSQIGLQLSFNLINLLTYGPQKQLAEAGITLADQRRVAAQAAVLAKVHLSRLQLSNAIMQLNRAYEIYGTDKRLATIVSNREAVQMQSRLDRINSDTAAILSLLRRYQTLAQVQAAQANLEATLGAEVPIGSVTEMALDDLISQVAATGRKISSPPEPVAQAAVASAAQPVAANAVQPVMASTAEAITTPETAMPEKAKAVETATEPPVHKLASDIPPPPPMPAADIAAEAAAMPMQEKTVETAGIPEVPALIVQTPIDGGTAPVSVAETGVAQINVAETEDAASKMDGAAKVAASEQTSEQGKSISSGRQGFTLQFGRFDTAEHAEQGAARFYRLKPGTFKVHATKDPRGAYYTLLYGQFKNAEGAMAEAAKFKATQPAFRYRVLKLDKLLLTATPQERTS